MKPTQPKTIRTMPTSEAARLIGCAEVTIRQWVARGKLTPAARIGRYMCFYEHDIKQLAKTFEPKK